MTSCSAECDSVPATWCELNTVGRMERTSLPLDFPPGSKFPPILLFYHTSMKELACKIDQVIKEGVNEREKKRNDVSMKIFTKVVSVSCML